MTAGFLSGSFLRGLTFRLLLFLTLALLPIGLIAVVQTREIARQSVEAAEMSLLGVTDQAAAAERSVFQEAFGAADALSSIVRLHRNDPAACSNYLRSYKENSGVYSAVAFIEATGMMKCSSHDEVVDFSGSEYFQAMLENPVQTAYATGSAPVTGVPVVSLNTPTFDGDELLGFVTLSVPQADIDAIPEPKLAARPLMMVTFNQEGRLVTTERSFARARKELPNDINLKNLIGSSATVFHNVNAAGDARVYAVSPILRESIYALSAWPVDTPLLDTDTSSKLGALLPVFMWIASLIVAFWSLNRLAITHIRKLGRQMRHFARNRTLPRNPLGQSVPTEIVEMEQAFVGMAESILRDEAALEDTLREKNILLKEVHHRVKNNLQLISSIMNMQIRQSRTADAKAVLQRLQERILSLATVHKSLYQNNDLDRVDGGTMLKEIVNQVLAVGLPQKSDIQVDQQYDPINLNPDDAAPLTLLTSEAVTNALKYVCAPAGKKALISISLKQNGPDRAILSIVNSTTLEQDETDGTGLGSTLISAFARQLNGTVSAQREGGKYAMALDFPVPPDTRQIYDY